MKAEFNKWYKCQEGQMPEDFENVRDDEDSTVQVVLLDPGRCFDADFRTVNEKGIWEWDCYKDGNKKAWMLPEPYKE